MPFKLKLKKSRQYNVSSKNLFVLSVELLDNTTVECTLSSQSLGQECLSNVCQRLSLQQPHYFGLRFLSKKGTFWWVDLERPLKRQLDKYALESCNLYLGVMFFVSDVNILHDEVTRYHYFLQLKSDILEGKLCCNEEQIILFASYSLQAEFGDHDPERHTTEYLTNFGLLPKHVAQGKENQEAILERVINHHRSLQGMSQQLAEVYYIMEAQHLNGYGLECFTAKDGSSNPIIVGVSLLGIYIWYMNTQPHSYFSWDHILNLVHHKRCFGIEHRNSRKVLQTYLEDSHSAKYVWKTCIQQHSFYTKNEGLMSSPGKQTRDIQPPNITSNVVSYKPSTSKPLENRSQHSLQESQDSIDGLGVYHTDGRYSERIASAKSCSQIHERSQVDKLSRAAVPHASNAPSLNTSSVNLASNASSTQKLHHPQLPPLQNSIAATPTGSSVQLTSIPHLRRASSSDVSIHQSQVNIHEADNFDLKPMCSVLPIYRQAPDYDTAIKLKYGLQSCSSGDMSPSHVLQSYTPDGTHVEVSKPQMQVPVQSYSQYKNYNDLSHLDINESCTQNSCNSQMSILLRGQEFVSAPVLHSPPHTYSTPDLPTQMGMVPPSEQFSSPHVLYHFKPPPPYPYKQRSSASTPDLTRSNSTATSQPSAHPANRQSDSIPMHAYVPVPISNAKIITSSAIQHQTIASSQKVNSLSNLPIHSYENYNPLAPSSTVDIVPLRSQSMLQQPQQPATNHGGGHMATSLYNPALLDGAVLRSQSSLQHLNSVQESSLFNPALHPVIVDNLPMRVPSSLQQIHSSSNQELSQLYSNPMMSGLPDGPVRNNLPVRASSFLHQVNNNVEQPIPFNMHPPSVLADNARHHSSFQQLNNVHDSHMLNPSHVRGNVVTMPQAPPNPVLPPKPEGGVKKETAHLMGPMLVAAMNGLSLSRPSVFSSQPEEIRIPNDTRIQALESRLAEGQVFLEFERILKRRPNAEFTTALLPENTCRNRFKDVFPYEENRVRLTPTSENKTGYINASHLSVSLGTTQMFYIAAQGPLPNTLYSFWQMIWEHHVLVIVMLTEVQEQGRDKCFPYWPQEDGNQLQIGEFQIVRNCSMSSPTYVTSSLSLRHLLSHQHRSVWHIQYTDWPDHGCPQDTQGFIAFMGEVDAVRRHAMSDQEQGVSSFPVVMHCSAGVGRSGAVILCDIMLHCLDHNQPVDLPKALTHLRLQRMLTVQTLAQYKFVYCVLIQYLKNSRLI